MIWPVFWSRMTVAARHADDQIGAILALAAVAAAVFARSGDIFLLIAEVHQGGEVVVHLEDDRAAAAAVAAVRPAGGVVLLTVEADLAVAALAGDDLDLRNVNKHWLSSFPKGVVGFYMVCPYRAGVPRAAARGMRVAARDGRTICVFARPGETGYPRITGDFACAAGGQEGENLRFSPSCQSSPFPQARHGRG